MSWEQWTKKQLASITSAGRWRDVRDLDACGPRGRLASGEYVVGFASNDYLGLTAHPRVIEAGRAALDRWGAGAGAARLVVGSRPVHTGLESEIADWKETEDALLFTTGYAANLGLLSALGDEGTMIFSDELNHASIVDGCRLARAEVVVFRHMDMATLDRMMAHASRAIVVSDSVFSMDGVAAPVEELAAICRRHEALLVLDEAHAVLGPHPRLDGVSALRVGTLSKTLGALGGFVAGSADFIHLLRNKARSFIFTTASSPADAGAALAALRILRSDEGDKLIERLRALVERLAPGKRTPIVSVVIGDERDAVALSDRLLERGFLVPAIRPPSVPDGTARLRITVSAAHTEDEVDGLARALADLTEEVARV